MKACVLLLAVLLLHSPFAHGAAPLLPATPGATWEVAKPEDCGFDADKLAKLADFIRDRKMGTTGLMVVVGGRQIYAYGDVAEVSYIASCRKSVLSMIYGKYVRNGTIKLSETVGELGIDDVGGLLPSEKRATVRDLITARSGCYHPASNPGGKTKGLTRGKTMPGEKFVYNNWDFNVAGTVLEMKTGKSIFDVFCSTPTSPVRSSCRTGTGRGTSARATPRSRSTWPTTSISRRATWRASAN